MEDQAWTCWQRLLRALEGPVPWGTGRPMTGQVCRFVLVFNCSNNRSFLQNVCVSRWILQGTLVDDDVATHLPPEMGPNQWRLCFGKHQLSVLGTPWPQCRLPRAYREQNVGLLRSVDNSPMCLGPGMPRIFLKYYVPRMMLEIPGGGWGMSDALITTLATAEYRVVLILAWQVCNSVIFLVQKILHSPNAIFCATCGMLFYEWLV